MKVIKEILNAKIIETAGIRIIISGVLLLGALYSFAYLSQLAGKTF